MEVYDVSRYKIEKNRIDFSQINPPLESEEVFNTKMHNGYDDAMHDRVKPIAQAFTDIRNLH